MADAKTKDLQKNEKFLNIQRLENPERSVAFRKRQAFDVMKQDGRELRSNQNAIFVMLENVTVSYLHRPI